MKKTLIALSALFVAHSAMAMVYNPTKAVVIKPTAFEQCSDEHYCIYTAKKEYMFGMSAFDNKSTKAINNAIKKKSCVKVAPTKKTDSWGTKFYSATSAKCASK